MAKAYKIKTYYTWSSMKTRCLNSNYSKYHRYGGRGIKICEKWMSFQGFYEDMGDKPDGLSLDRIDNNGDYCKENCKWSSNREQTNNTSRNIFIKYNGYNLSLRNWAEKLGIKRSTLAQRYYVYKWSIERCLSLQG